eukprot:CAMPEP_0197071770 /NCGR_PEP_ID=MMETSP1384-20130603/208839_1 /TAXON_ID=29189 /ORGANISM="Ammonia sp." /LENGTH=69 /DNA_ID=CAMNT_0042510533 /DNA_START=15 /DNA_END=224 /DNA_ORIENTATION=+
MFSGFSKGDVVVFTLDLSEQEFTAHLEGSELAKCVLDVECGAHIHYTMVVQMKSVGSSITLKEFEMRAV